MTMNRLQIIIGCLAFLLPLMTVVDAFFQTTTTTTLQQPRRIIITPTTFAKNGLKKRRTIAQQQRNDGGRIVNGFRSRPVLASAATDPLSAVDAALGVADMVDAVSSVSDGISGGGSKTIWIYFLETLISSGVPTLLNIILIGFVAFLFRPRGGGGGDGGGDIDDALTSTNPLSALFDDLYGDQDQRAGGNRRSMLDRFFGGPLQANNKLPKNVGVPKQEFLRITHLNRKYDSYKYSIQASTESKAAAAADYRQISFQRALDKAFVVSNDDGSSFSPWEPSVTRELQKAEVEFLAEGQKLLQEIVTLQTELTVAILDQEMTAMGMSSVFQMDPKPDKRKSTASASVIESNTTEAMGEENTTTTTTTLANNSDGDDKKKKMNVGKSMTNMMSNNKKSDRLQQLGKLQRELQNVELDFVQQVVRLVGPTRAPAIRAALLGDMAVRGSGALLTSLQERPLRILLGGGGGSTTITTTTTSSAESEESSTSAVAITPPKRLFVTRFPGDVQASQVAELREEVTGIIQSARANHDEAMLILQSGGGTVTGYGLAAAQLVRLKEAGLKLTVAVEQVAASGGYMMCCVADKIVASPFAVLGSIGVLSELPNVYERLKTEGIEFQTVTAGKYKRTLTPTKKVTKEDFSKSKEDVEAIFRLFRDFVASNRPQLDIEKVATGETWFGTAAMDLHLCDEIQTADDTILDFVSHGYDVYEVDYKPPIESPFGGTISFLQGNDSSMSGDEDGWMTRGIQWLVRNVANAVRKELSMSSVTKDKIEERYMAKDDSADKYMF